MVVLFNTTHTAVGMGAFTAIFMFCLMVFGPIAGACIDRWPRKKIFVACNLLLAVVAFSIRFLREALWIYVGWFLAFLLFTFLRSVRAALITNLFSEESYFKANSAFMFSLNLSKIGGPLIGGFLILSFSKEWIGDTTASFFFLSFISASLLRFHPLSSGGLREKRDL